jgi:hypothetical protein
MFCGGGLLVGAAYAQPACSTFYHGGPITVAYDGQQIQWEVITSTGGPAINTNWHNWIGINHVVIHHNGGPGELSKAAKVVISPIP